MNQSKEVPSDVDGASCPSRCSTVSLIDFQMTIANLSVAEHALREEPYHRLPALAGMLAVAGIQMEQLRQESICLKTALVRIREDIDDAIGNP